VKLLGYFDRPAPPLHVVERIVLAALEEDEAFDDRSTLRLPGADASRRGAVIAREAGVLAGVAAFRRAFELVAAERGALAEVRGGEDGARFEGGETVLEVVAPAGVLVSAERTALNFLQRLSGIATVTRRCVDAADGRIAVCDTRKTTPGLRVLEKWAVRVGGGTSHRWSLGDMVMLKENHLALAGGIAPAVAAVRAGPFSGKLPITIEVRTPEEAAEAAAAGVDRLLLDNMSDAELGAIAARFATDPARPELEASGGVSPERIAAIAGTGVDCVSLGSLTHSVRAIDFSFLIDGA